MRVALLLTIAASLLAQGAKDPYRELADSAMAAPAELAADLLIKLAASPTPDRTTRIEWLERAFALAPAAKFPLPRVASPGTLERYLLGDSDAGTTIDALATGLDAMSLQSRAVRAMMPLDRARAMRLFEALPPLDVPPLTCKDATAFSTEPYYAAVRVVLEQGFTEPERKDEKDLALLERLVGRMSSPFELVPAANLLLQSKVDAEAIERLRILYSRAVREIHTDDRSFTLGVDIRLFDTLERLDLLKATTPRSPLFDSLRAYLVRHLTSVTLQIIWRRSLHAIWRG